MRAWLPAIALVATALAAPSTASADVRLSTERSVTRWAHANLLAKVRERPSRQARSVARLRWQTEDAARRSTWCSRAAACTAATWMQIRIPGRPNGRTGGSAATRSAGCTRSTRR